MLQDDQTQNPAVKADAGDVTSPNAEQSAPSGAERRRTPRVPMDTPASSADQALAAKADRRKGERRSLDSLRAEALRGIVKEPEKKGFARYAIPRNGFMKPARLMLLSVALISGGLAAYLVTQGNPEVVTPVAQSVTEIIPEARTQILVAKEPIGVGERLSATSITWEDWPADSVREEYITIAAAPDAVDHMNDAVARFEFFPGEPIREKKLARADEGYLSVVLESGKRGVSVSVSADSASGGFIVPNDHVDIVATHVTDLAQHSETILHNVRVLAINNRLGENGKSGAPANPEDPRAQVFSDKAIATLELDPIQAEVIISASMGSRLSLVLLSITDFNEPANVEHRAANAAIRVSSPFWLE